MAGGRPDEDWLVLVAGLSEAAIRLCQCPFPDQITTFCVVDVNGGPCRKSPFGSFRCASRRKSLQPKELTLHSGRENSFAC